MKLVFALISGLVFGVGIAISGMMDPAKVLNFFDLAGTWDPSLAFVMGGALIVTYLGYRLAWARSAPLFGGQFQIPGASAIDARLIGGSGLFGVGWGIAGFCPGPPFPRWAQVGGKLPCSLSLSSPVSRCAVGSSGPFRRPRPECNRSEEDRP